LRELGDLTGHKRTESAREASAEADLTRSRPRQAEVLHEFQPRDVDVFDV